MCGIVGYVGEKKACPILLGNLKKLEYRGYDSAGIAVNDGEKIIVKKTKGRVEALENSIKGSEKIKGNIGIGHTRWATHGEPSDVNSHPHLSSSRKFAVVHNGIIENYMDIKKDLEKSGKTFLSQTDTEVIAHLFEHLYDGNLLSTSEKLMQKIEGSYSIAILAENDLDEILAIKKDSPLIIGLGEKETFLASDINALIEHTKRVIRLEDEEIAIIRKDGVTVYDKNKNIINKKIETIDWDVSSTDKCGYEHFMLKEIFEQPRALRDTISPRIKNNKIQLDEITLSDEDIRNLSKIVIIGCGSAYHVGCVAKYFFEKLLRIPTEVELASEFRYRSPLIDKNVLIIAISQSGETADTIAALKEGKKLGATTLSIVNVLGSSISKLSDMVLYTLAGPEIAVATTKAYSTQLATMYLIAIYFANKLGKISPSNYQRYINELKALPDKAEETLSTQEKLKEIAKQFSLVDNVFFIGRNVDYATSIEGSLKLKEISYVHSEAYAAGELKHGTISLIQKGTLVVALSTIKELMEKMISNIKEVKSRGAVIFSISSKESEDIKSISDFKISLPECDDMFLPSLSVIPIQLFSYYVAYFKGCDIDKPRNLAKSVTVE